MYRIETKLNKGWSKDWCIGKEDCLYTFSEAEGEIELLIESMNQAGVRDVPSKNEFRIVKVN